MSAFSYNGALAAGLILIALGVLFLVESLSAPFSAWRLLARYWPLILIAVGVRRIYLYFTWPKIPPASDKATSKE
jgi:Na+/H+-dicarboxylate symporter